MIQLNFDENKLAAIVENAVINALTVKSDERTPEHRILHSIRELSEFLGCSNPTAQKFKNAGLIPYRQVGRKVMFDTTEVLKALEKRGKGGRK